MALKIGLKYCSDCNPKYDRTVKVKYLMDALGNKIEFVNYKNTDVDYVLLVTSCDDGCAELNRFEGKDTRIIKTISDAENFVKEVRE